MYIQVFIYYIIFIEWSVYRPLNSVLFLARKIKGQIKDGEWNWIISLESSWNIKNIKKGDWSEKKKNRSVLSVSMFMCRKCQWCLVSIIAIDARNSCVESVTRARTRNIWASRGSGQICRQTTLLAARTTGFTLYHWSSLAHSSCWT